MFVPLLSFLHPTHRKHNSRHTKIFDPTTDDYSALEPAISGRIMELHHKNHHQTYVNSYNQFSEKLASASSPTEQISLQPMVNFHGGGHVNHSLFWENLAPKGKGGGEGPTGKLGRAIEQAFGGVENLKKVMNGKLAGIQGSGWAWLVKDKETGAIGVRTYAVSLLGDLLVTSGLGGIKKMHRTCGDDDTPRTLS